MKFYFLTILTMLSFQVHANICMEIESLSLRFTDSSREFYEIEMSFTQNGQSYVSSNEHLFNQLIRIINNEPDFIADNTERDIRFMKAYSGFSKKEVCFTRLEYENEKILSAEVESIANL